MSDIFISYAREDAAKASMLADALASEGWSIWWDPEIRPGEEWDHVIERELSSARCVVVLWSKSSVNKRWVRTEARDGLDRQILIPASIETVQLPFEFRGIQTISLVNWEGARLHRGLQHLLSSVSRLLGGRSVASGPRAVLREEDLRPRSKKAALDQKALKNVVFTIESGGRPLGTGFSVGRSTLLVSDANVFNGVLHLSRSGFGPRSVDRVAIDARPMAGRQVYPAELVLPPDQAQDLVLFDTTPWLAPPVIGLDHDPVVAGEDILCVVAVGDSRGIHRGRITGVDEATDIYGTPSGPAQFDKLLFTDIVTAGGSAGAPLLRRNGVLLGVVVAGDGKRSIAIPASRLWQRLTQARLVAQLPKRSATRKN